MTVAARDGGEEGRWASVMAGGDTAPVFEAAEHDLYADAAFVAARDQISWPQENSTHRRACELASSGC